MAIGRVIKLSIDVMISNVMPASRHSVAASGAMKEIADMLIMGVRT